MDKWELLGMRRNGLNCSKRELKCTELDLSKLSLCQQDATKKPMNYTSDQLIALDMPSDWMDQFSRKTARKVSQFLPDDIVRYIYVLCLSSNKKDWFNIHSSNFREVKPLMSRELNLSNPEEHWEMWDRIKPYTFNMLTPCYIDYPKKVICVKLSDEVVETIELPHFRKFNYNNTYYWFSNRCRCYHCDMVRLAALESQPPVKFSNSDKFKKLYDRLWICYNPYNKRWCSEYGNHHWAES